MTTVREDAAFVLEPLGPFSLGEAARFWEGFTPAALAGLDPRGHLHMAFAVEGSWAAAGVCVRETIGKIEGRVYGNVDAQAVKGQVARILSLDVDGRAFEEVGKRDQVVAELQRRYRGLRPVCFYSTYEAAVWAVLSQRVQMRQAARVKDRMREALGETVDIHGEPMRAFPAPQVLLELTTFEGLFGNKLGHPHAVAHAALAGDLDAVQLRSLPEAAALKELQALPGIGPFSSELILLRGAGHPDYLTLVEPRFRRAVEIAYQLDHAPTDDDLRHISDKWPPYRMWVTFLLRQAVELTRRPPTPETRAARRPTENR
jgi:DNA-3-methyladenine glycosylase II